MQHTGMTAHGLRSSFRDWCAERTNFPSEVAEMALAHAVGSKVEAAYRRGDLFERRRRIMADWAKFCGTPTSKAQSIPAKICKALAIFLLGGLTFKRGSADFT